MIVAARKIALFASLLLPASLFADSNIFSDANTLYGDIRYSENNIDNSTRTTTHTENNASRLGVKGQLSERYGITAFYHFETGVSIEKDKNDDHFTKRFYFAGIKGDFGKLIYGRRSTPYKVAGLKVDPFYDTAAGAGLAGATYGLSGLTNGWSENAIAYSKDMGSFSFNVGTYVDDTEGDSDSRDTNVGFAYQNGSLNVGVQYLDIGDTGVIPNSTVGSTASRLHARYKAGMWSFGGSFESIDPQSGETQEYIYLSTTYKVDDKLKVSGSYGSVDDVSKKADGDAIIIGAFYQLLKKTQVYALYSGVNAGVDRDTFAVGISYKFSTK